MANQTSFTNFRVYSVIRLVQPRTVKLLHTGIPDREVLHCDACNSYWRHDVRKLATRRGFVSNHQIRSLLRPTQPPVQQSLFPRGFGRVKLKNFAYHFPECKEFNFCLAIQRVDIYIYIYIYIYGKFHTKEPLSEASLLSLKRESCIAFRAGLF